MTITDTTPLLRRVTSDPNKIITKNRGTSYDWKIGDTAKGELFLRLFVSHDKDRKNFFAHARPVAVENDHGMTIESYALMDYLPVARPLPCVRYSDKQLEQASGLFLILFREMMADGSDFALALSEFCEKAKRLS